MGAVKLDHSDPAEYRAGIMQQLRQFWMDDHLCDVVLKSHDGAEHRAHTAVLSAASAFFKNLLSGSFLEAERVQQKQPVEIAASKPAVSALLDYIYDGQSEVSVEVGLEVLRLAEAYDLPKLAGEIEAGILACLDSSVALQVLQEAHGLHSLRDACEDKVAEEFETCSQLPDFGKLSASQLARILRREDLGVSREEAVVNAIFAWTKVSKDGHTFLGMLLQHVHFESLSIDNLLRLDRATLPGQNGDDLHREVAGALISRNRTQSPGAFQSKRRRLQHWSPFLGASTASTEASGREVLPFPFLSLCWHQGEIFAAHLEGRRILSWKPSDPPTCVRRVAGEGAAVTGINDLGTMLDLSISPSGEVFVSDFGNRRLVRFQNDSGDLVVGNTDAAALCYSPNGVLYVVSGDGRTVQRLVGSTLETVIASASIPADMQFEACRVFVTKAEVIYLLDTADNLNNNDRIVRINPAESLEPVVVGQIPSQQQSALTDLFVTDAGTIYVSELYQRKVLAFHPGSATFTEVLQCPDGLKPFALLVHDKSLYVSMMTPKVIGEPGSGKLYQYLLPPDLQLHEASCRILCSDLYTSLEDTDSEQVLRHVPPLTVDHGIPGLLKDGDRNPPGLWRSSYLAVAIFLSANPSLADRSGTLTGEGALETEDPDDKVWPAKTPNCLQPCGKGCFCMAAKHYDDIFFCDCTGRSADTERIYRQEMAYADVIKHPDKKGTVNPEWSKHKDDS
eukprot:s674_g12.t1